LLTETALRCVASEARLRVLPFEIGCVLWTEILAKCASSVLYHQPSWLKLLRRSYGFSLHLAALEENRGVVAACVLARTRNPVAHRFVALPFSDYCPPLARDEDAGTRLLSALAEQASPGAAFEIRGLSGAGRWHTVERFAIWTRRLDCGLATVERELATNYRRNLRRAGRENITVTRGSDEEHLRRFYHLHLLTRRRFGLPAQPWRFFKLARALLSSSQGLDVWLASRGGKDVASAVLISSGNTVYYKWGARAPGDDSRANHLLLWNAIEDYASRAEEIDLGRTDASNQGLMRFKKELGATATSLPYSYYPQAPDHISSETLAGTRKSLATVWSHLPVFATRMIGRVVYRYLA
jgi:hypothetical protein